MKDYYLQHQTRVKHLSKVYYERNRTRISQVRKEIYLKLRKEVLEMLGNKCAHCQEAETSILHIDHKYGDGYSERRIFGSLFRLRKVKEQSSLYQLLCPNCNWKKRHAKNEIKNPPSKNCIQLREEILGLLGNHCEKCSNSQKECWHIHHLEGRGTQDRKQSRTQEAYYLKVLTSIKTQEKKYSLLCANCHEKERLRLQC